MKKLSEIRGELKNLYHKWRLEIEEHHKEEKDKKKYYDSTDPGVRREFSTWIGLEGDLTYADMFELENEFEIER